MVSLFQMSADTNVYDLTVPSHQSCVRIDVLFVHLISSVLCGLKFPDEPLKHVGRIHRVDIEPPVTVVAHVHVKGDDSQVGKQLQ